VDAGDAPSPNKPLENVMYGKPIRGFEHKLARSRVRNGSTALRHPRGFPTYPFLSFLIRAKILTEDQSLALESEKIGANKKG
jgi:hypothetical protein